MRSLAFALAAVLAGFAAAKPPNVLFILTDDQDLILNSMDYMPRARELLMTQGTTFTHMFAATPVCCPSRSTFTTGRYIHSVGVTNNSIPGNCNGLPWQQGPELNNIGYLLSKNANYRTGYTGKYLNDYGFPGVGGVEHVPRGWDTWRTLKGNSRYYNLEISYADCTQSGKMHTGGCTGTGQKHGEDYVKDYLPLLIHNYTLDFIRQASSDPRPFFWVAATPSCHQPADPAPQYQQLYPDAQAPRTPTYNKQYSDTHWFAAHQGVTGPMDANSRAFTDLLARRRWQTLASVEDILLDAVQLLKDIGEYENTVIIYTADNGYHLGQRGLDLDKRQLYETDTRLPLFIAGPGVPKNASTDLPVANVDVAATVLDVAGVTDSATLNALDGETMLNKLPAGDHQHRAPVAGDGMRQNILIEYNGEHNGGGNAPVCPGSSTPGWEQMNCYPQGNGTVPPWFYGEQFCSCQDTTNNTYRCARTLNATHNTIYCHFVDTGFVEAYDMDKDPWQETNLASSLSPAQHAYWHALLDELQSCSGTGCGRSSKQAAAVDSHPRTQADLRGAAWSPMFPETSEVE